MKRREKKISEEEERLINELYRPPPDDLISSTLIDSFVGKYEGKRDENDLFIGYGFLEIPCYFRYRGNFKNGYMNGKGNIIFGDQTRYEGNFENNCLMSGSEEGHFIYPDGGEYFGDVANGYRHGKGKYVFGDKTYEGNWRNDQRDGNGKMIFSTQGSSYYEGEFKGNKRHGFGKMVYEGGDYYEGLWKNNLKNGEGKMLWSENGEKYEGKWKNGLPHGKGRYSYINFGEQVMNYFVGNFRKGKRDGFGTFYYSDGSKYSGIFRSDKKHGDGIFEHVNGICEELSFDQDTLIRDGKKSLFTVGRLKSIPLFLNDVLFSLRGNMKRNEIWDIQRVVSRNIPKLHILNRRYCLYGVEQEVFFDKLIRCSKKNEMSKLQLYKFLLCCGLVQTPPQGREEFYDDDDEEEEESEEETKNKALYNRNTISFAQVNRIIFRTLEQQEILSARKKRRRRRRGGVTTSRTRKKKREDSVMLSSDEELSEEQQQEVEDKENKEEEEEEGEGEEEEKSNTTKKKKKPGSNMNEFSRKRQNIFSKDYEVKIPDIQLEYKEDVHDLSLHPIQFRSFVEVLSRVAIEIFMEPPSLSRKIKASIEEEGKVYVSLRKCFEEIIIPNIDDKFENDEEELERTFFFHLDPKCREVFKKLEKVCLRPLFEYFSCWKDYYRDGRNFKKHDCTMTYRQLLKMFEVVDQEIAQLAKKFMFDTHEVMQSGDVVDKLNREIIFDEFVAVVFKIYSERYGNDKLEESLEFLKEKCSEIIKN